MKPSPARSDRRPTRAGDNNLGVTAVIAPLRLRLRQRPWLLVLAVGAPVAELVVLWSIGLSADRALAMQVTAPSPIAEYHDLRWLMVLQDSWLALALESAGALFLRSLINALLVHQAWAGSDRPRLAVIWMRTAVASLVLGIFIAPWAALAFGVDMVSVSWLSFAAIPPIIAVALANPHGPVSRGWWHQLPPRRAVGWVALVVVETTVGGAVVGALPAAGWVPAVAAGGLFNAWAWRGVVGAVTTSAPSRRRFVPIGPAVAVGMVAVAVAGTALSFSLATRPAPAAAAAPRPAPAVASGGAPVLVVSGFDTHWDGNPDPPPLPGPFHEVRFSYRGLGAGGQPLPYTAADTHQSVGASARQLALQVDALHRATGRRVNVVAESEGELVARTFAAAYPDAAVSHLILLSPLIEPGRVYYPAAGQQGYGLMTGYELRALTDLLGGISPVNLPADSPLLRSIVDHAAELRDLLSCPTRADEELIAPLADAVTASSAPANIPTLVIPAFHGGLLSDPTAQADIADIIEGRPVQPSTGLETVDTTVRLAASAWEVPPLPLSLFPTAGSDDPSCATMKADVQAWVATGS